MRLRMICVTLLLAALLPGLELAAQTVSPVISEYKGKGEGKFAVTNNTLSPMVVLLEPKSFSITPDGKGMFRPLDPSTHVELSTTSLKLAPQQTSYVFYRADAVSFPAWFTIYATFSQPRHSGSLDVRIMLPHTVYLYQKAPLTLPDVTMNEARYDVDTHKLSFELNNVGASLGRAQLVEVSGGLSSVENNGFPLLPGSKRRVEMDWTGKEPPVEVETRFEHFTVKGRVHVDVQERPEREFKVVPVLGLPPVTPKS
jgi:hypothetical protein